MLTNIHVRDLATIEEVNLTLENGNTMITGETGAGKSIFIEAIELGLGGRASANLVRPGKEKADISLCFDVTHFPHVVSRLTALDLNQAGNDCIIRRVITIDGRSRCYVNGSPATVQFIKELGELLFHLHSQHEQQVLLKAETQREMLDRYADHLPLVTEVHELAERYKKQENHIARLREKILERAERHDYLRFQLDELEGISLKAGEWEELEAEHHRLSHAEDLMHHIQQALQYLSQSEDQSISKMLDEVRRTLDAVTPLEEKAKDWSSSLQSAVILLSELESDLTNYLEHTDLDPERLQAIEERVSLIFTLARKHKIKPPELIELQARLVNELTLLNTSDEELTRLEQDQVTIRASYQKVAAELTASRQKAALKLQQEIVTTIRSLSLPHSEFNIHFENDATSLSPHGNEKIAFLIKTNPDQTLQPLGKVISGGELSRLSLAAHLALANRTSIPTLVFDEVDTGLSGATAEKIGKLLRKLGDSYQVFCITHQPQVAAYGHHHLLVEKSFVDKSTHTTLRMLTDAERVKEIARMLGGEKITAKTLEHAHEVLESV